MIGHIDRFAYLPQCSYQQVLANIDSIEVCAGQTIVRQGQFAERCYFIEKGCATVWYADPQHVQKKLTTTLYAGEGFGDIGFFMGGVYDATVSMQTNGRLGFIDSTAFKQIVLPAFAKEIESVDAKQWIDQGRAQWLDCRGAGETRETYLKGAQFIPLDMLLEQMVILDRNSPYIVYCYSGRRSLCATYLLRMRGYEAWSLQGGLLAWPYSIEGNGT